MKSSSLSWPNTLKTSTQELRMPGSITPVFDLKALATALKRGLSYAFKAARHWMASFVWTTSSFSPSNNLFNSEDKSPKMSASKNFVRLSARHAAAMSAGPACASRSRLSKEGATSIMRPKLCTASKDSGVTSTSSSSPSSSASSAFSPSRSWPFSSSESIQANSLLLSLTFSPMLAGAALSDASGAARRCLFKSALTSKRPPKSSSSFAAAHLTVARRFDALVDEVALVLPATSPAGRARSIARGTTGC
mmetsp:Transcript_107466/g.302415  ORF Transcript_107466/g.302415 Transcript_107466/m.302415 type:complete len:250 (-) Transcript_107466:32-781(-)